MSDVLVLAGSNQKNLELAKEFYKYFEQQNVSSQVVDLVSLNLPLYTPVEESKGIPKKVLECVEQIHKAKGFVFVVPEYNGGIPPVVTNFLAWVSRSGDGDWRGAFNAKPAAIATSSGGGGFYVLMSLRNQLSCLGLNVIGRQVRVTFKAPLNRDDLEAVAELLVKSLL